MKLIESKIKLRLNKFSLSLLLYSVIFCQRLAIPIGNQQMPLNLVIGILSFIIMLACNPIKIKETSLALFLLFITVTLPVFMFWKNYSLISYIYLIILYIPFLFCFNIDNELKQKYMLKLQNVILFTACFGIFQFLIQFIGFNYLDPLSFIPNKFFLSNFNTKYTLSYTSPIFKSNGGFYLEPSFYSQFLAIGIILEMKSAKRVHWLFLLIIGIIVSFSGTGLLILLAFGIPLFFRLKLKDAIAILLLFIIIGFIFINSSYSAYTIYRLNEFNNSSSSASIRFINPIKSVINQNTLSFLFGNGAGMSDDSYQLVQSNYSVIFKLWYEYGMFSMLLFMAFIIYSVYYKNRNILINSVFFMYLFLAGNLLQPMSVFFLYFTVLISKIQLGHK